MTLNEILRPKVDEAYCRCCCDFRRDVCVICWYCINGCGHKRTCPENE